MKDKRNIMVQQTTTDMGQIVAKLENMPLSSFIYVIKLIYGSESVFQCTI